MKPLLKFTTQYLNHKVLMYGELCTDMMLFLKFLCYYKNIDILEVLFTIKNMIRQIKIPKT